MSLYQGNRMQKNKKVFTLFTILLKIAKYCLLTIVSYYIKVVEKLQMKVHGKVEFMGKIRIDNHLTMLYTKFKLEYKFLRR